MCNAAGRRARRYARKFVDAQYVVGVSYTHNDMRGAGMRFLVTVLFLAASMPSAAAQTPRQGPVCAPRAEMVAKLAEKYGETRSDLMLDQRGNMMELLINAETGTWTMLVSIPGGPTCILTRGRNWVRDALAPQGDPT
jgi:hypothetical protein